VNPSYSFDRAADLYDATRTDAPETVEKVTQSILDLTGATPATRIVEVGIGTGRISASLIARGLNVTGLDLSREMMSKLRGRFVPETPLRLVQGDASTLPFPSASFDVGLAVHVFHVVAPWRQAIGELVRILRPGGAVLHSIHIRDSQSANVILRKKWHELVEARGERWRRPGAPNQDAVTDEFKALGASAKEIQVHRSSGSAIPQQEIDGIANRVNSDTWSVSDETLRATVTELTEWARGHFRSLDAPVPHEFVFTWQVFRFDQNPILPEAIRQTLMRLVPILNATRAPWVLAGSCNLALHGVRVEPHDIDISTDQYSAYQIGATLREIAQELQPVRWGEGKGIRSHRGLYKIEDVQVDIIGAAELREGDEWIPAQSPAEWKTDRVTIPGTELSVAGWTLEYALNAYRHLQREEKVKLIEARLASGAQ